MNPGGMFRRLLGGVAGQSFVRLASLVQAIALVPVLITAWGVEVYGGWLAVTALGSYVGLSNFGLSSASAGAMLLAAGAGDEARARRVFSSSLAVFAVIFPPVIALVALFAVSFPIREWFNIPEVTAFDVSFLLCMVALQVWLETVKGVVVAAICTVGRYGLPNAVSAVAKLIEVVVISLLVTLFDGGIAAAAVALVGMAALDLLVQVALTRRLVPWARPRAADVDVALIRTLVKPSLGAMLVHTGVSAIVVQGPRVLLSIVAGPAAVALFATHVTALRLVDQVNSLFVGPVQIETVNAVGGRRFERAVTLNVVGTQMAVGVSLAAIAALAVVGPLFFDYWTVGGVAFDHGLLVVLAAAVVASNFGRVSLSTVIGVNRVFVPALIMLPVSAAAIAFGALLARDSGVGGVALGWFLAELGIAVIAVATAARVMRGTIGGYLRRLLDPRELSARLSTLRARWTSG